MKTMLNIIITSTLNSFLVPEKESESTAENGNSFAILYQGKVDRHSAHLFTLLERIASYASTTC